MADYEYCVVLTTTDSSEAAEALANGAVEARLAASAQVDGPTTSMCWSDGEVQSFEEWRVTFKTTTYSYDALETRKAATRCQRSCASPSLAARRTWSG